MANLVTFAKKLWKDATSGGTPITAAELNRMEGGINDCATQINKLGDSVSRVTLQGVTEISFKVFSTCFEIWFIITPSNAYVLSMLTKDSPDAKCMLFHMLDGKKTNIKLW